MQSNCAVFRTGDIMHEGSEPDPQGDGGIGDVPTDARLVWNPILLETLEFDNLIAQAVVTMDSAANRTESRGAHGARILRARRQELDEAHAGVDQTWRQDHDRLSACARYYDVQRRSVYPPKARVYWTASSCAA
jgi:succinate dehydrogenase / fumarate reductase flavoprotein subunit